MLNKGSNCFGCFIKRSPFRRLLFSQSIINHHMFQFRIGIIKKTCPNLLTHGVAKSTIFTILKSAIFTVDCVPSFKLYQCAIQCKTIQDWNLMSQSPQILCTWILTMMILKGGRLVAVVGRMFVQIRLWRKEGGVAVGVQPQFYGQLKGFASIFYL